VKISISGIRGIFGNDFGPANILQFTTNFSSIIKSGKCVIGRDTRPSGEIIMNYVTAALMQSGIDVYLEMILDQQIFYNLLQISHQ